MAHHAIDSWHDYKQQLGSTAANTAGILAQLETTEQTAAAIHTALAAAAAEIPNLPPDVKTEAQGILASATTTALKADLTALSAAMKTFTDKYRRMPT